MNKNFLTKEESNIILNGLKERGFQLSFVSENVFFKGTRKYRKQKLERVLKGKLKIRLEELENLLHYSTCKIISKSEYESLSKHKKALEQIREIANNILPKIEVEENEEIH